MDGGKDADHYPRGGGNGPCERGGDAGTDGACERKTDGQHPVQQDNGAGTKAATASYPAGDGLPPEPAWHLGKAGQRRGKADRPVSDGHGRGRGNPQQNGCAGLCIHVLRAAGVYGQQRDAAGDHRRFGAGDGGELGGGHQGPQRGRGRTRGHP